MADLIKKKPEEEAVKPPQPQKPGYQSQWGSQISDIMDKIQNREKFHYDFNGDALYNQYKDRFMQQGKLAMQDTMGQAAALTGGYGNSYAQSVGQQAYQGYMQGLNDKIPELFQLALDKYNRDGNALFEQYGLLTDRDNAEYNRFQDAAALAQSQVNAMIQAGQRPSDELLLQSGLSKEYVDAILKMASHSSGGGSSGGGSSRSGGSRSGSSGNDTSSGSGSQYYSGWTNKKLQDIANRGIANYEKNKTSSGSGSKTLKDPTKTKWGTK